MSQPLPPQLAPLPDGQESKLGQSAYNRCREAESHQSNENRLIPFRLLGWMLQKAPSVEVRSFLSRGILSIPIPPDTLYDVLHELGLVYIQHYVQIFRAAKGRTPYQSHPSRPSFDKLAAEIKDKLIEAPASHQKAKMQALHRDGYQCVVTGYYDKNSLSYPDIELKFLALETPLCVTNCCHILSPTVTGKQDKPSSTDSSQSNTKEQSYASNAWAILTRFGGVEDVNKELFNMLNGSNAHKLYNILTMSQMMHTMFDELELWFEATETLHSYRVVTPNWNDALRKRNGILDVVTFTSPDLDSLPLPDPRILKLHAACAEVAHLSGAAEYITNILNDIDEGEISVLAEDGSSSALQMALARRNDIFVH